MSLELRPNKVPYKIPMPNNMGVVRYILALGVVISHYNSLIGGSFYFPISVGVIIGGFFSLSGFLVYGGYLKRKNFRSFIISRMIRLLPAYLFIVLLCAVGLVFVSTLPANEYYGSSEFWKYLGANLFFLNFLQPTLPGVFEGMDIQAVNGSLWTQKIILLLYLSVPVVVWLVKKLKNRITLAWVIIFCISVSYRLLFRYLYDITGQEIYDILERQVFGQMLFFYTGVLIYYWFDVFRRYRWYLMAGAMLLMLMSTQRYNLDAIIDPVAFSVLVIGISMTGKWGTWEGKRDNVSYNIYLVHYPICQLAAYYGLKDMTNEWICLLIVLGVAILLSLFMNYYIEKPIQKYWRTRLKT